MNMGWLMWFGNKRQAHVEGVVLIEVLLAAGILGLLLAPLLNLLVTGLESNWFASQEVKAQSLVYGQLEGLRSIRERNWNELVAGGYYVDEVDNRWQLISAPAGETVDQFVVQTNIEPVYRREGVIVDQSEPGAVLDPSTVRAEVVVTWHILRDRRLSVEAYLTRYLDNLSWTQTTTTDFNAGTHQYTETVAVGDGAVQLQGGCAENPQDGPLIFTDEFYNTWQIFPSAGQDLKIVSASEGEVKSGIRSLRLNNFAGANTKLRNFRNICTLGFTRFEFWVYNTAEIDQSFGIHVNWEGSYREIVVPPREWMFVSMAYDNVSANNEINLDFLHFKPFVWQLGTIFYLDDLTLAGGSGGYYQEGVFESSIFDAGRRVVFNRISHVTILPSQTAVGFQVATSENPDGPWVYYGPGGTTGLDDVYLNSAGEGIWLGNNYARFLRYRAVLRTSDGRETPVVQSVTVNYSP